MRLRLNLCVPVAGPLGLAVALEALVSMNRVYLRTHRDAPALYQAGVRYLRDADNGDQQLPDAELWLTIPDCLASGGADCKVLSAYRVAELREQGELGARCSVIRTGPQSWHVAVVREDGRNEDPSAILGM